jgi:hypothetical protein
MCLGRKEWDDIYDTLFAISIYATPLVPQVSTGTQPSCLTGTIRTLEPSDDYIISAPPPTPLSSNKVRRGDSALCLCIRILRTAAATRLLERGIDPFPPNEAGETAADLLADRHKEVSLVIRRRRRRRRTEEEADDSGRQEG